MYDELRAVSPNGRLAVSVYAWEVRMSLWIETPRVFEQSTNAVIWTPSDHKWSLNRADWVNDSTVRLGLRKYPGNHNPSEVTVTIDCDQRVAQVEEGPLVSLDKLEQSLDRLLDWV